MYSTMMLYYNNMTMCYIKNYQSTSNWIQNIPQYNQSKLSF